jgi:two-component system NtrC family sensor kinase
MKDDQNTLVQKGAQSDIRGQPGTLQDVKIGPECYHLACENVRDALLFIRASDGHILEANRAAIERYGYERAELLSLTIYDLHAPETRRIVTERMSQADSHRISYATIHRRQDGSLFPVTVSLLSTTLGDERVLLSIICDSTDSQGAEAAIRRHNQELAALNTIRAVAREPLDLKQLVSRTLDEVLRLGVFEVEVKGMMALIDSLTGKVSLIVNRGIPENHPCLVHLLGDTQCRCRLALAQSDIIVSNEELQDERRICDWPDVVQHVGICLPLNARGRVLGVLSLWLAATPRVADEDVRLLTSVCDQISLAVESAQLNEEARHRANELAALNKSIQAMVSTLDFESVLKLVIGEVRTLLDTEGASVLLRDPVSDDLVFTAVAGPGSEQLVGKRIPIKSGIAGWVMREREPVLVDDAQSDPRFFGAIDVATGLTTRSVVAVPLRYKGAVWGVVEAINGARGKFGKRDREMLESLARSAAIAIENARLFQAERELHRLVDQSRLQLAQTEKMAAMGRLAASLAHEINNPLQAIYNCLHMLLHFDLETEDRQEYLQTATEEVERLSGIVTRTLDFARRPPQEMKAADLNEIIAKVLTLANKYFQHCHIELEQELSLHLPPILATADELTQVLLNLILNAVDAMPEGGTLRVTSWLGEDKRVAVALSDTGRGIPPEYLQRIFEPFFSTKNNGTGLGLAISYSIVQRHGGEIKVESQVEEGTTFTVWLPVAKP